ncbi:hypothetical protein AMAG_11083 [Allomyces macrogynus ATCC 38327]|uniref:Uncharacterized protein n=1 Tax=Allomyces macrogynus (strain ATCC 38327) TaxID=578462 RepID=A0A0L0SSX4_ALLM3|nr:hypothetical protein AMAG_11083 [Allomyces macrogynus ATCC 38327]|eukprot:KNE65460.1 hypothetical protein AMAG_11083 [Allomyces macrogynus ATCC 38327]
MSPPLSPLPADTAATPALPPSPPLPPPLSRNDSLAFRAVILALPHLLASDASLRTIHAVLATLTPWESSQVVYQKNHTWLDQNIWAIERLCAVQVRRVTERMNLEHIQRLARRIGQPHRTEWRSELTHQRYNESVEERRLVWQERELRCEIARDLNQVQREVQQVENEYVQAVEKVKMPEKERDKLSAALELQLQPQGLQQQLQQQ